MSAAPQSLELALSTDVRLAARVWRASTPARADLVIVHGFGEHGASLSYRPLIELAPQRGLNLWSFDLPGHGLSPGARGHIDRWDILPASVGAMLNEVRRHEHDRPLFALGVSLGAIILLDWLLRTPASPLRGIVIGGAPVGKIGASRVTLALARFVARFAPRMPLPPGLDNREIATDPQIVKAYTSDPLFHQRATAAAAAAFLEGVQRVRAGARALQTPVLWLHGEQDRIAHPSREYFDAIAATDKTWISYARMRHDLFLEPVAPQVTETIVHWIEARA